MLPLVNRMAAGSSRGTLPEISPSPCPLFRCFSPARRTASSAIAPGNGAVPRATTIRRRTVGRPQPRGQPARIAFGIPMKTSGAASRQHCRRLRRPIPGSMSTRTIPALNTAKTRGKRSIPGGTISTARVPGAMPIARRPSAISSLSTSSKPKLM